MRRPMLRNYTQLLSLMERETALYASLVEVLDEETAHLVSNDADGLLSASRRKDTISLQIRSLEESRLLLIEKFSRPVGQSADDLRFSDLFTNAPAELRAPLEQARDRLKSVVTRVTRRNHRNRQLVENSLRLLHGTMETLQKQLRAAATPSSAAYGPGRLGPVGQHKGRSLGGVVVEHSV
jgi:flagellar biosynthesis/type III secretory pathway chaperone